MVIAFSKMSGAGNDFVVIDNRSRRIRNGRKAARILCDRRWGVGADGLLLLEKSRKADYRMMYYNADGSYGGMCGNGGRCLARFAVLNRIAGRNHHFEALDYVYSASVKGSEVTLSMKNPREFVMKRHIKIGAKRLVISQIDTGAPHVIVPCRSLGDRMSLAKIDVHRLGQEIRNHKAFEPGGMNVNFIERRGSNSIAIRTYERGVEAETLACGTGSIASAIVASRLWKMHSPVTIISASGKLLKVDFNDDGMRQTDVRLTGPAEVTFKGKFKL